MLKTNNKVSQKLLNNSKKYFSQHAKYLIVGGGSGGSCVAGQLLTDGIVNQDKDITVIDKSKYHYYQPGFTKIGGGVYNREVESHIRYDMKELNSRYNLVEEMAKRVDAENNKVILENGDEITYDNLILSPGLDVVFDSIPGLEELLEDPRSNVCSVYKYEYAVKTAFRRELFKGGKAIFTQPPAPIKCAGAPQKLLYLSQAYWKSHNVNAECHFFTPLPGMFGIAYYNEYLEVIAKNKGVIKHPKHVLSAFKNSNVAIFKNLETGNEIEHDFDFIHVVPPMRAPALLKNSPEIIDSSGFIDVNSSLRHKKYKNIWAIGDSINLPNAKTAAAVFSQAPVLVENLKENSEKHHYSGYSACPIFLGNKELMLAEFKIYKDEKGDVITKPDETFAPGRQVIPNSFYYYLTYTLGYLYPLSHMGVWYGRNHLINPTKKNAIYAKIATTSAAVAFFLFFLYKIRKTK